MGCGIGGSSRILANYYGFNVTGITGPARLRELRTYSYECKCNFKVMDALDLKFEDGSFDGLSVGAEPI